MAISITNVIAQRQQLIDQIDQQNQKLKRQFKKNPLKMNVEPVQKLISQLVELNEDLQARHQNMRTKLLGDRLSVVFLSSWICASLVGVSFSIAAKFSHKNPKVNREVLPGVLEAVGVLAILASDAFAVLFGVQRERHAEYAQIARIESSNERNFKKFLEALNDFKISRPEDQRLKLCRCVQAYDWIDTKYQIMPREEFIPKMILSLDTNDPMRVMMEDLLDSSSSLENDRFRSEQGTLDHTLQDTSSGSYRQKWRSLEEALGMELDELKVGDITLFRDDSKSSDSYAADDSL